MNKNKNDERRYYKRFSIVTPVFIESISNSPAFMKDISRGGCKVAFSKIDSLDMNARYRLKILSHPVTDFKEIVVTMRPVWRKADTSKVEVGFELIPSLGVKGFIEYVDLIENVNCKTPKNSRRLF